MVNSIIAVGDVVAFATEPRGVDNMEVQMPEGVRLTIPTGKTWIKWRSAIVEAYFKATAVQK